MHIDLNCDIGEGIGNENLLMPLISSANIACGFHAGDEMEMRRMVTLCLRYNVAIGAHPSFPDRENFGRREMIFTCEEIQQFITEQLTVLSNISATSGGKLHHVKPHGALYNMAVKDISLAACIAKTVKDFDDSLIYYGLSGSVMIDEAIRLGLLVAREVFADRTYQQDGSLTPRTVNGALITDDVEAVKQVMQMINEKTVTARNGNRIPIQADTICIHGDGPNGVELAKSINAGLHAAGIQIRRPH